jgi:hypothetical protein
MCLLCRVNILKTLEFFESFKYIKNNTQYAFEAAYDFPKILQISLHA